jgi:glycogen synthase
MTTDTVGGVWSYAMELAQGLSRLGVQVGLAAMGGRPSRAARADARKIPGLELFESIYKLEWMKDPWRDVDAAANWLMGVADRFRPDVVHLNGFVHGDLPWSAPVLMVAHSCRLSWWRAVKSAPVPAELDEYKQRATAGVRAAQMLVAPTQAMLNELVGHYGEVGPTRIIPHGRSLGLAGPAITKEAFVLAAGRLWDEAKNVTSLDQAAPKLSWPVFVAGDTQHPEAGAIATHNLRLLGRLHSRTLSGWLARAAIYASPARYEPFGLAPLEAAYAGCALVLGDLPSLREVWGDAAVYVAPNDHAELSVVLQRLIADERLRRIMSERALARAQMFSGCRMLASYREAYTELLAGRALAPARPAARAPSQHSMAASD